MKTWKEATCATWWVFCIATTYEWMDLNTVNILAILAVCRRNNGPSE